MVKLYSADGASRYIILIDNCHTLKSQVLPTFPLNEAILFRILL